MVARRYFKIFSFWLYHKLRYKYMGTDISTSTPSNTSRIKIALVCLEHSYCQPNPAKVVALLNTSLVNSSPSAVLPVNLLHYCPILHPNMTYKVLSHTLNNSVRCVRQGDSQSHYEWVHSGGSTDVTLCANHRVTC